MSEIQVGYRGRRYGDEFDRIFRKRPAPLTDRECAHCGGTVHPGYEACPRCGRLIDTQEDAR